MGCLAVFAWLVLVGGLGAGVVWTLGLSNEWVVPAGVAALTLIVIPFALWADRK